MKIEEFDKKLKDILEPENDRLPEMKNKDLIFENIQSQIFTARKPNKIKIYYSLASVACLLVFATLFIFKQKNLDSQTLSVNKGKVEIADNCSGKEHINNTSAETPVINETVAVVETKNVQPPKRKKAKTAKKAEKTPVVNTESNPQENDEYVYIIVVEDN